MNDGGYGGRGLDIRAALFGILPDDQRIFGSSLLDHQGRWSLRDGWSRADRRLGDATAIRTIRNQSGAATWQAGAVRNTVQVEQQRVYQEPAVE